MKKTLLVAAALSAACAASLPVHAGDMNPTTLAVIGDWPYGTVLFNNANLLINSVNADPAVRLLMHVGDIHSGSQPCTSAGFVPLVGALPDSARPGYNQSVHFFFQQFRVPVVYTPGDNEWTDCHKNKQGASGAPLRELASVRELFFAKPGRTLGRNEKEVHSQAIDFNPAFPADKDYVENVMWEQSSVVFVTVNMPGSNNDGLPWNGVADKTTLSGPFLNEDARKAEVANRTAAAKRWLEAAFHEAEEDAAVGVVIGLQADMWDPAAVNGDGLEGYTEFVQKLADLSTHFNRPVLLINGDSHLFGSDRPLADPTSATGQIHKTQAVPNLTRITVQGSTNSPAEWLRLTVDPRTPGVFSWRNVVYCQNIGTNCQ
jgi:hypothetical protein